MRELSHNYFPLTLGKGKPLYIRSIYTFPSLEKSRYFPEFFFPKENLIFLDFFLKERKEIFSTFSLSVKFLRVIFPPTFSLLFLTYLTLINPKSTVFFQSVSYCFFRNAHIFRHRFYCHFIINSARFKCCFK